MLESVQPTKTVVLEPSTTAKVYSVKVNVVCLKCGSTWGVKVLSDYTLPLAWDECLACKAKRNKDEKDEQVQQNRNEDVNRESVSKVEKSYDERINSK